MKMRRQRRREKRTWVQVFGYFLGLLTLGFVWSWITKSRRVKQDSMHVPETADERTMRRIAEEQAGGMSTQEGLARYERGEHPGGLHGKAVRLPPDAESFEDEEPADRLEIHRGGQRAAMPAMRR